MDSRGARKDYGPEEGLRAEEWIPSLRPVDTDIKNISQGLLLPSDQEPQDYDDLSGKATYWPRYVNRDLFSLFIPETDPSERRARTCRIKMAKRSAMLSAQLAVAILVVVINTSFTSWAWLNHSPMRGVGTFYVGDCTFASRLNSGLHVLLNGLSTLFLGTGNYCMQVIVAPSKAELKAAHLDRKHYDIGIHSLHNLRHIARDKCAVWALLGVVSSILHLIWNSAVFPSIATASFPVALASSDFLIANDTWTSADFVTDPASIASAFSTYKPDWLNASSIDHLHQEAKHFARMDVVECIKQYANPMNATAKLVLVTNETAEENNGSSLISAWMSNYDPSQWNRRSLWMCNIHYSKGWCTPERSLSPEGAWIIQSGSSGLPGPTQNNTINFCLVGEQANGFDRCGFHYSAPILILVCICTGIGTVLIGWVKFRHSKPTLVLIGDIISTSLQEAGQHLEQKSNTGKEETTATSKIATLQVTTWSEERPLWFTAISVRAWIVSIGLMFAALTIGFCLLGGAVTFLKLYRISSSIPAMFRAGLGKTQPYELIDVAFVRGVASSSRVFRNVLFANSFQLMVSFVYLFFNNVLTCQLVADELIRFLTEKKPLRVSSPENQLQRSSYFLSLPWKYAIPQMLGFALLHWLVSQSVFIVQTNGYGPGPDGQRIPSLDASRVGYSAIGVLLSTLMGVVLVVALVGHSFRRYKSVPSYFPRMATNSSALSALCHPSDEDTDAYLYPTKLGIVVDGVESSANCRGRLAFSSDWQMKELVDGRMYEQPVWIPPTNDLVSKRRNPWVMRSARFAWMKLRTGFRT